ncbi:hypothetical protein KEM55_007535 [Ascosphaera atra]|nr:hypothetical protein KEM55_007535 [Ascosphaera atra]
MVSPSKRKISEDQQAKMQAARRAKRGVSDQGEGGEDQHTELAIRPPPVPEAEAAQAHEQGREHGHQGNENHQQSNGPGEIDAGQDGEERVHEQAAHGEETNNDSAFEQFQPVPDPDPFQREDPLGGVSTAMSGVEAPTVPTETIVDPVPSATATAEVGIGVNEAGAQASRQAETVSSVNNDDNDDEDVSTMPEGFELAPGTTKAREKRAYRSPQRFIDKEIAYAVMRDGCEITELAKWRFTALRQLEIIESWPNGRQPSIPVFRCLPIPVKGGSGFDYK